MSKFAYYLPKAVLLSAASALSLTAGPVAAQDNTPDAAPVSGTTEDQLRQVFQASYFNEFAPQSALDMINRVPGFRLRISNNNGRGLGQRTDNVLLNGRQLSSKSSNIGEQLERLTVDKVVRIEIIDGTTLGIPGLTGDVANVITKSGGLTGTWEWRPQFRNRRQPRLNDFRLSLAGEAEDLTYSVSLSDSGGRNGGVGQELRSSADGVVFEDRLDDVQIFFANPTLTGTTTWTPKPDYLLTLNGSFGLQNFNDRTRTDRLALTERGESGLLLFNAGQDAIGGELGFDYEQPLGIGKIKLIGLGSFFNSESGAQIDSFDSFSNLSGSRFEREIETREYIGRGEYSFGGDTRNDWTLAFETAFNNLSDNSQLLERQDLNGGLILDPSTLGDTLVEEIRSIATITRNWKWGPKWDFQLDATGEYSEISSETITGFRQSQDFIRPRGRFSATYAYDESLDIRFNVTRSVGQLNFFAFLASVSLDSEINRTGNINLIPEQTTSTRLEFDKTLWKESNLRLTFLGSRVDDVIDSIPIGLNGDGIGNLEDPAYRYGASINGTLKGVDFNFPGLEWNFTAFASGSTIEDPLTGVNRRVNDQRRFRLSSDIRYDFQNSDWAIGSDIDFNRRARNFRVTTTELNIPTRPSWDIFIEHQNVFGVKMRLDLNNLLNEKRFTERVFFEGRRDLTGIDFIETRNLEDGLSLRLTLSGNF